MSSIMLTPRLFRVSLLLDAAISGATGLLMAAGHALLAPLLGLPPTLLLVAGLVLLPYALGLLWLSRRDRIRPGAGWAVVGINAVWAIDSVALLALGWVEPTTLGLAFVLFQAAVVAVFAEVQWWTLRRGRAAQRAALA